MKSKTKRQPKRSRHERNNLPSGHEERVFLLGSKLLATLEKNRLPRNDETVKGIAYFLLCLGERLEKGATARAKELYKTGNGSAPTLGVGFSLIGLQVCDWATGLLVRSRTDKPNVPCGDN